MKQLENELSDFKIHSNRLETKLRKTESELTDKEKENQADKAEIKRLRNLKWYDKLFGEK